MNTKTTDARSSSKTRLLIVAIGILAFGLFIYSPFVRFNDNGVQIFLPIGFSSPTDYQMGHKLYGMHNPGIKLLFGLRRDQKPIVIPGHAIQWSNGRFAPWLLVYHNERIGLTSSRSRLVISTP